MWILRHNRIKQTLIIIISLIMFNPIVFQNYASALANEPATDQTSTVNIAEDENTVTAANAALTSSSILGTNTDINLVIANLSLPTVGLGDTTINWNSSSIGIIAADGTVTRPEYSAGNATVTLTATISKGLVSQQKKFVVTVKKITVKEVISSLRLNVVGSIPKIDFEIGEKECSATYNGVPDTDYVKDVTINVSRNLILRTRLLTLVETPLYVGENTLQLKDLLGQDTGSKIAYISLLKSYGGLYVNGWLVDSINNSTIPVTLSMADLSITGITLNKTTTSIAQGTSETLIPAISPFNALNKNIKWTSSYPSRATVDTNGKVTGVAGGTARITATTVDGGEYAVCTVTVTAPPVPAQGVSLNKETNILGVGGTDVLSTTFTPINTTNKKVVWSSSNINVATVSDTGTVTGVAPGTATISTITSDGGFTANCRVTVIVAVTDISLNKASTTLTVNAKETLTASVSPVDATDRTVNWSSSDSGTVTVDQTGVITAVALGTATISVTTIDGTKTAICVATVIQPVNDVILNKHTTTILKGATETLTATVEPINASNKNLTWSSSNSEIATVNNYGGVTGVAQGIAVITVTTDDNNKSDACSVTVNADEVINGGSLIQLTVGKGLARPDKIAPAKNVRIPVSLDSASITTGFNAYSLNITYDPSKVIPSGIVAYTTDNRNGIAIPSVLGQITTIDATHASVHVQWSGTPVNVAYSISKGILFKIIFTAQSGFVASDQQICIGVTTANFNLDTNPSNNLAITVGTVYFGIYGDVNSDGQVNGTDSAQIVRYALKKSPNSIDVSDIMQKTIRTLAADVNSDGQVNGTDSVQIVRYALEKKPNSLNNNYGY